MTETMTAMSDRKLGVLALSVVVLLVGAVLVWYSYQFTVCLLGGLANPPRGRVHRIYAFSSQASSR